MILGAHLQVCQDTTFRQFTSIPKKFEFFWEMFTFILSKSTSLYITSKTVSVLQNLLKIAERQKFEWTVPCIHPLAYMPNLREFFPPLQPHYWLFKSTKNFPFSPFIWKILAHVTNKTIQKPTLKYQYKFSLLWPK